MPSRGRMFNQAGPGLTPPSPFIHRHSSLGLCHVCLVRTTKETSLTHRPDKLGQARQSCSSRPLPTNQINQTNKITRQTSPVSLVPQAALLACFFIGDPFLP